MKKLFSICVLFLMCCCIFNMPFFSQYSVQAQDSMSSARAMVVVETNTMRVLYQKNPHKMLAMASTTKIMTALTTIMLCTNLDESVNISPKAVGIEGTSIYLKKGETLTVRELLYGLMLPSGNDAAVALAIHAAGSEEKFVAEMNLIANRIGCTYTHFANPHGLDARGHFTTAYDLALITAKAMQNKDFCEISATPNITIPGSKAGTNRYLKNKNRLVGKMDGCTGVKIGFTDDAGRCLVASINKNNFSAISVVLNCGPMFEECQYLLEKATSDFEIANITNLLTANINVENSIQKQVKVGVCDQVLYPLTKSEQDNLTVEFSLPNKIIAPALKGTIVGKAKVLSDGCLLFEKDLLIIEEAKPIQKPSPTKEILNQWF